MNSAICESSSQSAEQVVQDFFRGFSRPRARDFFRMNLVHSYSEAIMAHHPESERLDPFAISGKVINFIDSLFSLLDRFSFGEHAELLAEMNQKRASFWELVEAHRSYRAITKQEKRFDYLSRHLIGKSLVDVGCGSGELLHYLATHLKERFLTLIGIEIGDFRKSKEGFGLHVLDLRHKSTDEPIPAETGLILSTLHHIDKDKEMIVQFLKNVRGLGMKQLIVEEDILVAPEDMFLPIKGIESIRAVKQKQFKLKKFLPLPLEDQHAVTTMADYLSNSLFGAYSMPFPFAFQTIKGWCDIFNEAGFEVAEFEMLGFQQSNFNQVCHALFILG